MFARTGGRGAAQPEKKVVDLKADVMYPIEFRDTSAVCLVGNVAFYHSGAVITCDSAVRYSEKHMECFGNVLINKNDTYVYGDRADYNGETHVANVYSDLVKVVDGDATLYTYKFLFNTKTNVGEFADGGVVTNRENQLESDRGYYYANDRTVICVDRVEIRSEEYDLTGDSVVYNLTTDHAYYFRHTNIWNTQGDYLYADRGSYDKGGELYTVTENGYILTEKQEVWSDSIDYYKLAGHAVLRGNIQIDDTEHKVLAFGDYGEYWKEPGDVFLTRRPSVVSYDLTQGDSLFMRADSMFLFTVNENARRRAAEKAAADSLARMRADSLQRPDSLGQHPDGLAVTAGPEGGRIVPGLRPGSAADSLSSAGGTDSLAAASGPDSPAHGSSGADSLHMADSLSAPGSLPDSLDRAADTLTVAQRKALLKEAARKAKAEKKAAAAKIKKAQLDSIAVRRKEKATAKLLSQKEREEARLAARRLKAAAKLKARQARAARKGKVIPVDSAALRELDSLIEMNMAEQDSLLNLLADSLLADTGAMALPADSVDSLALPRDSIYRLMKGYRDVRIFRSDFQTVCDSIVGFSIDSTIHMYTNPVLWNGENQITAQTVDIFTKNQTIEKAVFKGEPLMCSRVDSTHFNQVKGKVIETYFNNGEIFKTDVNGNGQTYYYMEDGDSTDRYISGFLVAECADITFRFTERQVSEIVYRGNPSYSIYPMDKIPETQSQLMKGFKWEIERKPTKEQVFTRTIRPSQRARYETLSKPTYPITGRIDKQRTELPKSGWIDRTDRYLSQEALEFVRSLGN